MAEDTFTPNIGLRKIAANRFNWADRANENFTLLDAVVSAYFTISQLQGIWANATVYEVGDTVVDDGTSVVWKCLVEHTSAQLPTTFLEDRTANPTYWENFSVSARSRGAWQTNTAYSLNNFVVYGSKYAVCIIAHVSGTDFDVDAAAGKWEILVDLSTVGSQVLPVPSGSGDANKAVVIDEDGLSYIAVTMAKLLNMLGSTEIGKDIFRAADAAAVRALISAQVSGSYQPLATSLTTLSGATLATFGVGLLALANDASARSALGLGTMAVETASQYAKLASPAFVNQPTAPTQALSDSSTRLATTAFVHGQNDLQEASKWCKVGPLLVQWGTVTIGASPDFANVTFPVEFPAGGPYHVGYSRYGGGGGSPDAISPAPSTTGFVLYNGSTLSVTFSWFAFGPAG